MDKIKKDDVQTYVQFYLNDVELNISVTNDIKKKEGNVKNFGYIQVSNGQKDSEDCFWDNLEFFFEIGKKEFKEECKEELKQKGFDWEQTYKTIKKLLKRAKKLNLITLYGN